MEHVCSVLIVLVLVMILSKIYLRLTHERTVITVPPLDMRPWATILAERVSRLACANSQWVGKYGESYVVGDHVNVFTLEVIGATTSQHYCIAADGSYVMQVGSGDESMSESEIIELVFALINVSPINFSAER